MNKTGICFIINHPFPKPIPVLKSIYGDRFSKMLFLIPFHQSDDEDVFTVYQGSYNFNAMIVEARHVIAERFKDCSHVLFVADDLILAQNFDEGTASDLLGMTDGQAFVAQCDKVKGYLFSWHWQSTLPYRWRLSKDTAMGTGCERYRDYLPSIPEVRAKCEAAGVDGSASYLLRDDRPEKVDQWWFGALINKHLFETPGHVGPDGKFDLEYPFFAGYSDLIGLPMASFGEWIKTIGVLSALGIFPEISLPTSLVWTFGKVNTTTSLKMQASVLWDDRHLTNDAEWVLDRFDAGDQYIHPIKFGTYSEEALKKIEKAFAKKELVEV